MRRAIHLLSAGLIALMIVTGCSVLSEPDSTAPDAANGTVVLSFGNAADARTAYPDLRDFDHITLTLKKGDVGSAPSDAQFERTEPVDLSTSSATLILESGLWVIDAVAYVDAAEDKPSVRGTTNFELKAGSKIQANINLDTVVEAELGAKGYFDFSVITLPSEVFATDWDVNDIPQKGSATLTLTALDTPHNQLLAPVVIDLLTLHNALIKDKGTNTSILKEWTVELPEGIYNLSLNLDSGNSITVGGVEDKLDVVRDEAVYIYPYATTRLGGKKVGAPAAGALDYLWVFEKADFQAGIWLQGTATVSSPSNAYRPAEVNIYNSYGRRIDQGTANATIITGATGSTVTWEYYIADVTKELGTDPDDSDDLYADNDYQEALVNDNYAILVEIIAQSGTKRLRSFPQQYNLTNKHGRVTGIEPSMSIYSLDLASYTYGDLYLDRTNAATSPVVADGLTFLNAVAANAPTTATRPGSYTSANGRIVRTVAANGKQFDVVGPVTTGTSNGQTPYADSDGGTYTETEFTVKVVATGVYGVQINKTLYNGGALSYVRYPRIPETSPGVAGLDTPLTTTWVEYPTSLKTDDATITARFFTFNASARLVDPATGDPVVPPNVSLTAIATYLRDPADTNYNPTPIGSSPLEVPGLSLGTPVTATNKPWTQEVPASLKYLPSDAAIRIVAKVENSGTVPPQERIYTYTGQISELDTEYNRQINIEYLNPFSIALASGESFYVYNSTNFDDLGGGFTLSASSNGYSSSINLYITPTYTSVQVDGTAVSGPPTTISASSYTLGQHALTISGTSATTGRPISKTILFTVVR